MNETTLARIIALNAKADADMKKENGSDHDVLVTCGALLMFFVIVFMFGPYLIG